MVKKRRLLVRVKPKNRGSKSPQTDGDDVMNSARQKFKGALQDLLPHSDDDSTTDEDSHHWNNAIRKARREASGGKRGLGDKGAGGEGFRNSFIMKLFDRTVDLSNYTESTPLYPICRAWIKNSSLYSFNRKMDEVKEEGKGSMSDEMTGDLSGSEGKHSVSKLPPPVMHMSGSEKLRVPKPVHHATSYSTIPQQSDDNLPSREELLADNLAHWTKVRHSWREASRVNEQRYSQSIDILTNIFNNAQKTF